MIYLYFTDPRKITVPVAFEALITREGFNVVVVVDSSSRVTIGSDVTVSRNHARIFHKNNKFYIQDLGSLNGTRVNGKPIEGWGERAPSKPLEIVDGDVVEVGYRTLFIIGLTKEHEEESRARDICRVLNTLKEYLQEILDAIDDWRRGHSKDLESKILPILERITGKEYFIELLKQIQVSSVYAIERHMSYMRTMSSIYQGDPELVSDLEKTIKSIRENIKREYKERLCSI